jgi:hypothetical protein
VAASVPESVAGVDESVSGVEESVPGVDESVPGEESPTGVELSSSGAPESAAGGVVDGVLLLEQPAPTAEYEAMAPTMTRMKRFILVTSKRQAENVAG